MIAAVLSDEGVLSGKPPSTDRAKAGRTGAPERSTELVAEGGAPGGAAPCRRARAALQLGRARRVR